ncbi:unnamed protein product [Microthlaspi erraticum]|uniref:F-box domain-containing protein n=1 Tax=Microthlaspi erraticum TaxID=1685480 RepID=A0A6D2HQP3_9BRAS|nr:unnamed protein product [Microthlaspi erraticum]
MSDIPSELVEEILSRAPPISWNRLRFTCKLWNSLSKPIFTEKHFHKAPKHPLVLMLKDYRICSMRIDFDAAPPSIEFKGSLGLTDSHSNAEQDRVYEVIHCDGLLLCITKNKIVVWNPWLGQTRWIKSRGGYKGCFGIGYENNKSCRSYKILRFGPSRGNHNLLGFNICELRSNSWRVLDDVSLDSNTQPRQEGIVSLKGNSYWLGEETGYIVLLCFDYTTERLKRPHLPLFPKSDHAALSAVRDEKLSVLHWDFSILPTQMTVWVTDRIDAEAALSWSKAFKVDLDHTLRNSFPIIKKFLYDEEKKMALCCDLSYATNKKKLYVVREDDEHYSEIPYVEYTSETLWPYILHYVLSLVNLCRHIF